MSVGSILSGVGRDVYRLGFEISPIVLTNGIAASIPGQMLPIVVILEAANLVTGILNGAPATDLDAFFAHFRPLPGASLIKYGLGEYPFANQATAANAIVGQARNLSYRMSVPVNKPGGHTAKFITFIALKALIEQHAALGGTWTCVTPTAIETNMILLDVVDVSDGQSVIPQDAWQWNFKKPLITAQDAQAAQNTLMSKLTSGLPTDGSLSGPAVSPTTPLSGGAAASVPTASGLPGASAGGQLPPQDGVS